MTALGVLYIDLSHISGEGDNDPSAVIIGPESIAAGKLCTADGGGYSDCGF